LYIVDTDLQVFKPSAIQSFYPVRSQQVSVGNERHYDVVTADAANHFIQFRVQQRLTTAEGNDSGAKSRKKIDTAQHHFGQHWIGSFVVFVAIGAREIATADRDDVGKDGMMPRFDRTRKHPRLTIAALERSQFPDSGGQPHKPPIPQEANVHSTLLHPFIHDKDKRCAVDDS